VVQSRHHQAGGLPGSQVPLMVIKKVLCILRRERLVRPVAKGIWRYVGKNSIGASTHPTNDTSPIAISSLIHALPHSTLSGHHPVKLKGIPTYGNPIDFRGLRHEPVNEDGVIFLFGMVADELGYLVEAVQAGFPDCEAKRQIDTGKWQRVRIEFEFESRNFRDHGHSLEGCDVIVCWRHNWQECPEHLEVVELRSELKRLSSNKRYEKG
jgi:hypothetical protein